MTRIRWRRAADDCGTGEATRKRETRRDKEGENMKSRKRSKKQENRTQGVHSNKAVSYTHLTLPTIYSV